MSKKLIETETKELRGYGGQIINKQGPYVPQKEWLSPRSPRQIMQWLGTEYRRSQDPSYWLRRIGEAIANTSIFSNRIVITDVRFDNEAAFLKELSKSADVMSNYQLWRTSRTKDYATLTESTCAHASEGGVATQFVDVTIANDHDIIDLVGPILLHWLALESKQDLHTISTSRNHVDGWSYE